MVKRKENPWQFKFSFALAILMLFLVFGYFTQSFLEIRKVKPVSVAIERLSKPDAELGVAPIGATVTEKTEIETAE
jgi:hypothetical protein